MATEHDPDTLAVFAELAGEVGADPGREQRRRPVLEGPVHSTGGNTDAAVAADGWVVVVTPVTRPSGERAVSR